MIQAQSNFNRVAATRSMIAMLMISPINMAANSFLDVMFAGDSSWSRLAGLPGISKEQFRML